jgi:hypothetical protein
LHELVFSHANGFVDPGQGVFYNQPILLFAEERRSYLRKRQMVDVSEVSSGNAEIQM